MIMLTRFARRVVGGARTLMRMQQQRMWIGNSSTAQQAPREDSRSKLLRELNIQHLFQNGQQEQSQAEPTHSTSPLNSVSEQRMLELLLQRIENRTIDPNEMAFMLHFFEEEAYVQALLTHILPHLESLEDSEFLFVCQKMLAYRPQKLPQVPLPRNFTGLELVLVVLSELYPAHKMIHWVQRVVLWEGDANSLPILCMGLFTIRQNLSEQDRQLHKKALDKAHQFLFLRLIQSEYPVFITSAVLALELNNPLGAQLLTRRRFQMAETTIQQLCWLLININTYQQRNGQSRALAQQSNEILQYLPQLHWQQFMKVAIYVGFWRILKGQTSLKAEWKHFADKLMSFSTKQYKEFSLDDLTPEQVVEVVEVCQQLRISNQQLLYCLLYRLQGRLMALTKQDLVRLVTALVTYVRMFQDFFVQLRKVCDQRRPQFSYQQSQQLHRVFQRCRVLFSRPFLP